MGGPVPLWITVENFDISGLWWGQLWLTAQERSDLTTKYGNIAFTILRDLLVYRT